MGWAFTVIFGGVSCACLPLSPIFARWPLWFIFALVLLFVRCAPFWVGVVLAVICWAGCWWFCSLFPLIFSRQFGIIICVVGFQFSQQLGFFLPLLCLSRVSCCGGCYVFFFSFCWCCLLARSAPWCGGCAVAPAVRPVSVWLGGGCVAGLSRFGGRFCPLGRWLLGCLCCCPWLCGVGSGGGCAVGRVHCTAVLAAGVPALVVFMFSGFLSVGFSGSRSLSGLAFGRCRSLAAAAVACGCAVSVGCAAGADAAARLGAGGAAVVWSVASGRWGRGRGAFAGRSAAFVRALAAAPAPLLVSFPAAPCPAGLRPSASSSSCFSGFGSGSWASLALAVGLGVPVRVFLPAGVVPPAAWGAWSLVAAGPFAGAWVLGAGAAVAAGAGLPAPAGQLALF